MTVGARRRVRRSYGLAYLHRHNGPRSHRYCRVCVGWRRAEKEGTAMIEAYDVVELLADMPDAPMEYDTDAPLHAGDSGTVVAVYPDDGAYTVEFMRGEDTVSLTTVAAAQVRVVWRAADHGGGMTR